MSAKAPSKTRDIRYSHTIGLLAMSAYRGFQRPVDVALSHEGLMYVVNRPDSQLWEECTRIIVCSVDSDYLFNFGGFGSGDGQFIWPVALAFDSRNHLYLSDEYTHRISIFGKDGEFIGKWGKEGFGDGQLNHPSGIAFDREDSLYVVDTMNHRVQKFAKDGRYLGQWGKYGNGDGEFNMPWGIAVDKDGNVYVADWRNDRIQKFTWDGKFLMKFGASGRGDGELSRPSYVAVDRDGDVYASDWGNNRVQVFNSDGGFRQTLWGDADLSKWAQEWLAGNRDQVEIRAKADLEPERRFTTPLGIALDPQGRIFVVDNGRYRVQIYRKEYV